MRDKSSLNKKLDPENKINIENHFGLVHLCCQRFRKRGVEYEDLFQSGCIGLAKAAKNFDFSKGVQFSTYAIPVILGEIRLLIRDNTTVKVGRRLKELSTKINYEREKFLKLYEREPSIKELSNILKIDGDQILEAIETLKVPISLDAPIKNGDSSGTVFEIPIQFDDEKISTKISVIQIIKAFDARDKSLIYLRFFKGITQSDVAKTLGMTQVQVSRREKILLKILREKLA